MLIDFYDKKEFEDAKLASINPAAYKALIGPGEKFNPLMLFVDLYKFLKSLLQKRLKRSK